MAPGFLGELHLDHLPCDGPWSLGDVEAGRLLCAKALEASAVIIWTHPETRILSAAVQDDGDSARA